MTAARAAVATVLVLLAVPAGAESPSPVPEDRTTSITVSPTAAPDRAVLTLRGYSDCAVLDGHLLYTRYDGSADNLVVRATSKAYDYAREKYPYAIRLTVPVNAAPGPAEVYAAPFCGPPEEYPSSAVLPFRVQPGRLTVRVSPRRPDPGERLRVRASTCDGGRGRLTVRVRVAGRVLDRVASVDGAGYASVSVRLGGEVGPGEASLPRAKSECPGSVPPAAAAFSVRAPTAAGPATTAAEPAPLAPTGSPSPAALPSATGSAGPTRSTAAAPTSSRGDRSRGSVLLAVLAVLGVGAALTAAAVLVRRRARRP